ncbi:RNA polymerase sigma factor SigX [compost metagenome]
MVKDKKHSQLYAEEVLSLNEGEETFTVDQEYQNILIKAIAELPPSQQRVLQLRQQGLKSREIAGEMGISIESVKKYQQWATKSVSKFLKLHTAITISVILSMN